MMNEQFHLDYEYTCFWLCLVVPDSRIRGLQYQPRSALGRDDPETSICRAVFHAAALDVPRQYLQMFVCLTGEVGRWPSLTVAKPKDYPTEATRRSPQSHIGRGLDLGSKNSASRIG